MSKRSGSVKDSDAPSKEENGGEESRIGSRQSKRNANKVVLYNDDYSDDDILPPKKGKRSRKRDSEDSNFSDSADDGKSKKKRRRSKKKKAKEVEEVEDSNSEEEDSSEAKSSTKKSKAKEKTKKQADGKKEKSEKLNKIDTDYESIDFSSDKTTTDGKPWNFKISSWNVGGLKALVKKNGMEFLKHEDPDIFCMQETKCSEDKIPEEAKVEGYHTYWVSGEKEGYAGVGVYTKQEPINVTYGLGNKEFDDEGRLITAEFEKFYLIAIYVPNAGRGLVNLPKRMKWDPDLRKYLKDLEAKKPIILVGDMNVSHEAIDLANPKSNAKNAGFTQEERDGMTALLNEGFIDSFRQLYPDKTGAYTFWTYMGNARSRNVGWRLDYFILSKQLLPNLCDSVIRSEVYGSDHCPITLLLHI